MTCEIHHTLYPIRFCYCTEAKGRRGNLNRDIRNTTYAIRENEPNLPNAKMNINYYKESNYEEKHLFGELKNEPKRTQFGSPFSERSRCLCSISMSCS